MADFHTLDYTVSATEVLKLINAAKKRSWSLRLTSWVRVLFYAAVATSLLFGTILSWRIASEWVIILAALFLLRQIFAWCLRYFMSLDYPMNMHLSFQDSGVEVAYESGAAPQRTKHLSVSWKKLVIAGGIAESDEYVLLGARDRAEVACCAIPKRAFSSPVEIQEFRAFVEERLAQARPSFQHVSA